MRVIPTGFTSAPSRLAKTGPHFAFAVAVRSNAALSDCRRGHPNRARLVSSPIPARLHLPPVRPRFGADDPG